eukprot:s975_g13.t1
MGGVCIFSQSHMDGLIHHLLISEIFRDPHIIPLHPPLALSCFGFWRPVCIAADVSTSALGCGIMTLQADSPCIHLTFVDGEVEVVNRNTFLDVDVLSPDSREELRRTKSCPALLEFHEEMFGLQSPDIMDSKHWARLTTDSTQSTEFRDSDSVAEFDMNPDAPNLEDSPNEEGPGVALGDEGIDWQSVHTVMIKNIPCRCSTEEATAKKGSNGIAMGFSWIYTL